MKIIISFTIILTVISLLPAVSAEVNLSSQSEVKLNEEFSVRISSDLSGVYDVKIYIRNESEAILSEIFDGDWKNSRFYINEAFPAKNTFSLRAFSYSSESHLCGKLRLSEKRKTKSPTPESCIKISIEEKKAPIKEKKEDSVTKPKSNTKKKNKENKTVKPISQEVPQKFNTLETIGDQNAENTEVVPLNTLSEHADSTSNHLSSIILFLIFFVLSIFTTIWLIRDSKARRENI
jgi:hypothetical protein